MTLIDSSPGATCRYDTWVFEEHHLSNDIRVFLQQPPICTDDRGMLIASFENVGSIQDPIGLEGLAHFFEHIPMRGTNQFPRAGQLAQEIKEIGGSYDWATSNRRTTFEYTAPKWELSQCANILYDTIMAPLFREKDVSDERGVIQAEYRRKFEGPLGAQTNAVRPALYGNSRFTHTAIGTTEAINKITASDLAQFHKTHYHAGNLILICGGAFSECPEVLSLLEERFGNIMTGVKAKSCAMQSCLREKDERHIYTGKEFGRNTLLRIQFLPRLSLRETIAMDFLLDAIAEDMNSPLVERLRTKAGELYESNLCNLDSLFDTSVVVTNIPIKAEWFGRAEQELIQVLTEIDQKELAKCLRMKKLARTGVFTHPNNACRKLTGDLDRYGKVLSQREAYLIVDSLTIEEIRTLADLLLRTPAVTFEFSA